MYQQREEIWTSDGKSLSLCFDSLYWDSFINECFCSLSLQLCFNDSPVITVNKSVPSIERIPSRTRNWMESCSVGCVRFPWRRLWQKQDNTLRALDTRAFLLLNHLRKQTVNTLLQNITQKLTSLVWSLLPRNLVLTPNRMEAKTWVNQMSWELLLEEILEELPSVNSRNRFQVCRSSYRKRIKNFWKRIRR